jgi:hypothetical protein
MAHRATDDDAVPPLTLEQSFARIEATERAVARIWLGLRTVELIYDEARPLADDTNRDLPLETVALGLEHLMKVTLVLGHREHTGSSYGQHQLRQLRHDLARIDQQVIGLARDIGYGHDRPAVRDDLAFLTTDPAKRQLIQVMTSITDTGRYDALNEFVGGTRTAHPATHLDAYEQTLLARHPDIRDLPYPDQFDALACLHRDQTITTCLRWTRALTRMFTLGFCGRLGQQLTGTVSVFLYLRDHELDRVPPWR